MNRIRALLVEDEANDVFFFQRAMAKAWPGCTLQIAWDGQEAIDYLSRAREFSDRQTHPLPCLVLLDLNLPKVHGFEVLRWIRANPALENIPVVILTSSLSDLDKEQAYKLKANSYLVKPNDPTRLTELVERMELSLRGINQSSRHGNPNLLNRTLLRASLPSLAGLSQQEKLHFNRSKRRLTQ